MSEDKTYNGWTNYETWNVKLWIDNEEPSYNYWRETAQECWNDASEGVSAYAKFTGHEIFSREDRATLALADRLRDEINESAPDLGASMFADLLNEALSEVNWQEIALAMIQDCDQTEDETEDSEEGED